MIKKGVCVKAKNIFISKKISQKFVVIKNYSYLYPIFL